DDVLPLLAIGEQPAERADRRQVLRIRLGGGAVMLDRLFGPADALLRELAHLVEERGGSRTGLGDLQLELIRGEQIFPAPGAVVEATEARQHRRVARVDGEDALAARDGALQVAELLFRDLRGAVQERRLLA